MQIDAGGRNSCVKAKCCPITMMTMPGEVMTEARRRLGTPWPRASERVCRVSHPRSPAVTRISPWRFEQTRGEDCCGN